MPQQDPRAAPIELNQYAIHHPAHERNSQPVPPLSWSIRRLPTSMVADLDPDRLRLRPKYYVHVSSSSAVIGVLNGVGGRFVHGEHDFTGTVRVNQRRQLASQVATD
jgi:hypothetical protein